MGADDVAKEYAAGLSAGIATVVVGHPFDTVKVKMQAYNTASLQKVYKSAWHCTTRTLMEEGIPGLYRGASSSFVGMALEGSIFFGTYSHIKQLLQGRSPTNYPQLQTIIPSAAFSGALISLILTPTELVKCRMQVQGISVHTGPLDYAFKTLQTEGIRGLFRGGVATMLRESIGNSVFFCTYEFSRFWLHASLDNLFRDDEKQYTWAKDIGIGIISGGLGGISFWSAVLPIDVAKTIIQTNSDDHTSRSVMSVVKAVYRNAGLGGCYAGLGPTLARAFPANAAAIVAWEFTAQILGIGRR